MTSIVCWEGPLVHIQDVPTTFYSGKKAQLHTFARIRATRDGIYTYSKTRVKEISPTDKMESYLDPVLPPTPLCLGSIEPRLLDVYSIPPAELLHV